MVTKERIQRLIDMIGKNNINDIDLFIDKMWKVTQLAQKLMLRE